MTYPKRVTAERLAALIPAAAERGCLCLSNSQRVHEGKCISCWALTKKIEHIEYLVAATARPDGSAFDSLGYFLEKARAELKWRVEEVAKRRAGGEGYD